ncbi:MAG: menaquinone biosynthesis decarboxylase [Deltaproteobacteria bacterium]|nr:menaquinone biosynthesis decarboxylase [Deltaproteobacteria bacterium]
MKWSSLRQFIDFLASKGELVTIREEVDPVLEIAEIADRVMKAEGPALLFEKVKGSPFPLAINLYGSRRRMSWALGVEDLEEIPRRLKALLTTQPPEGFWDKLKMVPKLAQVARATPKTVVHAPCQEIVWDKIDLNRLPILKCWPEDGGRFITLPMVITQDPDTGRRNVGLYRMQVLDHETTAMHWQIHKVGARHFQRYKELKRKMPVAVAIGGDPVLTYCATAPLPDQVDEILFAGYLRGDHVEMVDCHDSELQVPASADFILEGYIDPEEELVDEGPFGDHTGYYTPVEKFPRFHVKQITQRRDPIYLTTIVGIPPMEDKVLGLATERLFLPMIQMTFPEIVDMHLPAEACFHNLCILSIKKAYPGHAQKIMHALWGMGQMMFCKCFIVVDHDVDVHNFAEIVWRVSNNIDAKRDLTLVEGPVDHLDHAAPRQFVGAKLGIDATRKWKEEGYTREWPKDILMSESVKRKIDALWPKLGITLKKP